MRIGELAERVAVKAATLRYYESVGLLPEARRTTSGYRDYGEGDIERVTFIKTAQRIGMTLEEIREVLALRERDERPCGFVLDVVRQQVKDISRRIKELQRLRSELITLQEHAEHLPPPGQGACPIIDHVRQENAARPS